MGQRDGFARSDLLKINKMYNCGNTPSISKPTYTRPTYEKPNRPSIPGGTGTGGGSTGGGSTGGGSTGGGGIGGFTNPVAQVVSGIGSFFQFLGGKHDENDNFEKTNVLGDD